MRQGSIKHFQDHEHPVQVEIWASRWPLKSTGAKVHLSNAVNPSASVPKLTKWHDECLLYLIYFYSLQLAPPNVMTFLCERKRLKFGQKSFTWAFSREIPWAIGPWGYYCQWELKAGLSTKFLSLFVLLLWKQMFKHKIRWLKWVFWLTLNFLGVNFLLSQLYTWQWLVFHRVCQKFVGPEPNTLAPPPSLSGYIIGKREVKAKRAQIQEKALLLAGQGDEDPPLWEAVEN